MRNMIHLEKTPAGFPELTDGPAGEPSGVIFTQVVSDGQDMSACPTDLRSGPRERAKTLLTAAGENPRWAALTDRRPETGPLETT